MQQPLYCNNQYCERHQHLSLDLRTCELQGQYQLANASSRHLTFWPATQHEALARHSQSSHGQEDRGDLLAVLAVSPDMGVADFCTWAGGYLPSIRDMRFVRRDDARASCLVLLRFSSAATAASFHKEHNNKAVADVLPSRRTTRLHG